MIKVFAILKFAMGSIDRNADNKYDDECVEKWKADRCDVGHRIGRSGAESGRGKRWKEAESEIVGNQSNLLFCCLWARSHLSDRLHAF